MNDDYGAAIDRLTKIPKPDDDHVLCQHGIRVSRCGYTALGERCGLPGTMSWDTRGPGTSYCRLHWERLQGRAPERAADPATRESAWAHLEAAFAAIARRRTRSRAKPTKRTRPRGGG